MTHQYLNNHWSHIFSNGINRLVDIELVGVDKISEPKSFKFGILRVLVTALEGAHDHAFGFTVTKFPGHQTEVIRTSHAKFGPDWVLK